MKTFNQFDASVRALNDGIPKFTRTAYNVFLTIEEELFNSLKADAVSNPASVEKISERLLNNIEPNQNSLDILSALRIVKGKEANDAISRYLITQLCENDFNTSYMCSDTETIEEPNGDSPDIYAPLSCIKGGITNFPSCDKHSCWPYVPTVLFQTSTIIPYSSNVNSNSLGYTTLLDDLRTECIIDIFDLFKMFYSKASFDKLNNSSNEDMEESWNTDNGINVKMTCYNLVIQLHSLIREPEIINSVINEINKVLLRTCITTYLIYVGKLRGVKSDLCGWLYTFFVKDSMRDVEKGDYPDSSDITLQAGMQSHNDILSARDPTSKEYSNNAADKRNINASMYKIRAYNGGDPNFDASVFYKNIRLLYSNWAAIINTVIKIDRSINDGSSNYVNNLRVFSEDDSNNPYNINSNSIISDHVKIARSLMLSYLSCRFRTYNTPFQLKIEKGGIINNDELLKAGVNAIVDIYNKATIKDCCTCDKNEKFFIKNNDEIQFSLNATRAEIGVMADKFMSTAYLIMLDYIHSHQEQVMTQDDAQTGKPNRELFEEVYNNLKKSIYSFIYKSYDQDSGELLIFNTLTKDNISEFTLNANGRTSAVPYSRNFDSSVLKMNGNNEYVSINANRNEISNKAIDEYSTVNKHLSEFELESILLNIISSLYIVPPVSDEVTLKMNAHYDKIVDEKAKYKPNILSQYQTRATSLFPKNQVIVDEMSKMRLNTKGILKSIESAVPSDFGFNKDKINDVCDKIESSLESEWAHMSYNDLASIGGNVVDYEITNEETAKVPETESKTTEEPILDSNETQAVVAKPNDHVIDIKQNVIADTKPNDSDFIKDITTESKENIMAIERYNKLFNRIVFDIK